MIKRSTINEFMKGIKKEIRLKIGVPKKFKKELKKASKYI